MQTIVPPVVMAYHSGLTPANRQADGFAAHGAHTAEEARVKLASFHPDLLMLGELEQPHTALGLQRGLRSQGLDGLPLIVVSSDGSELAQLRAFAKGSDHYLKKPVSYPLLLARLRALLRRSGSASCPPADRRARDRRARAQGHGR